MNKEPKTLPQAIKIIVGIYGKDVVKDVQIVNIMNDVVSLEDPMAVKSILRDVIKMGYGGKMLAINSPKDDYRLKVKAFSKDISDTLGYKEVMVQYILYSIAYGIGICPKEPYLKNMDVPKREKEVQATNEEDEEEVAEERRIPFKAIAAIFLVFLIGGSIWWYGDSKASANREKFDNMVFTGNSLMSNGDYDNALESYKEAYNGYNTMNSDSYKENALEKIEDLVDKLIKDGETNNKSLVQAYSALESALQLNLNDNDKERLKNKKDELEKTISGRLDNGRNTLITSLSANNGKLDDSGKQLLDNLLELAPNDYWLNFIKKKSYE